MPTIVRITNNGRDTKDFGWWNAKGRVDDPKTNAPKGDAVHINLGSRDDAMLIDRDGRPAPSIDVPLEVFKALTDKEKGCKVFKAYIEPGNRSEGFNSRGLNEVTYTTLAA